MNLSEFMRSHRQELIERTRAKVALRSAPRPSQKELTSGVPLFLSQLEAILRLEAVESSPAIDLEADAGVMGRSATQHGHDLLESGFTIAQVVHDYGDVCQATTELAGELNLRFSTAEFRTLNRCLDNVIASAVTEYGRQRELDISNQEIERLGFLAHELRNNLNSALLAFQALKRGQVGIAGSTGAILERSLTALRHLIDRSLSEVRLDSGGQHKEQIPLARFLEELEIGAAMEARSRRIDLTVASVDPQIVVVADRQLLASAVSNLLQNALKFTSAHGHVWLRTSLQGSRVLIAVEDECGGLPRGRAEQLFRPFVKGEHPGTGLGLGLAISQRAVQAQGGEITVRDLPGKGCVFTISLPLAS
jgi:signal transduction histidine kinase